MTLMTDPEPLVIKISDAVMGPDGPLLPGAIQKADRLSKMAVTRAYLELRKRYPVGAHVVAGPHRHRYEVVGLRGAERAHPVNPRPTRGIVRPRHQGCAARRCR